MVEKESQGGERILVLVYSITQLWQSYRAILCIFWPRFIDPKDFSTELLSWQLSFTLHSA